ncbi:hypothetical protein [Cupriavidus consociatus]|uniref:hypothetical protein n=1 Tax=Cupriavidus consociatus TaxID=2821357 RepID=UPI001AEB6A68|nr:MULTISPECIES: hypothetical protein [unclassified Cupriavidus]MBP0623352.1 hypothetical protein [Cupriavidus sp. LEh25]MDK2660050.1 hypothetical protein [Cupriavidus sp. LEh21]
MNMFKKMMLVALAAATLSGVSGMANAGVISPRDSFTDGAHATGARDPFGDGSNTAKSFDSFTDGA